MDAIEDRKIAGRGSVTFADEADIDEFVDTLGQFERGELSADEWRAFRLVRGTYGQRQIDNAQMLRVKIPQGILSAAQLQALADVAERHSRGFGHITTRQNLQFHFMKLDDVEPAMRRLAAAGLTTREACGNTVRNVTACPYAGTAADEAFDVTPYADAMSRYLLRHSLSASLPRKFKIAFEGCPTDHALTAINDIGWRARVHQSAIGSVRGFRATVGGGTSILSRSGRELFDFLPAGEMLLVAEAILRVFHRFGDYEHKQRNRMKFLIDSMGWTAWRRELVLALDGCRAEGIGVLPFDPDRPPVEAAPDWDRGPAPAVFDVASRLLEARPTSGPGLHPKPRAILPMMMPNGDLDRWQATNVRAQRQEGYALVVATVPLGDLTGAQLRVLADLSAVYGDGTVRVTPEQNLLFRWVPAVEVFELYQRLAAAGLSLPGAGTVADVTSCPGAESCRIAVTQSRGLASLLGELLHGRPDLVAAVPDLKIKISGCPNGCGHHHIAGLGLQGSLRRIGSRVVPHYFVTLGGGVGQREASFGRLAAKIPARRLPEALERLVRLYLAEREESEGAVQFFQRVDLDRVRQRLGDLESLAPEALVPADYVDLGETVEFRPEIQQGECSA